MLRRMAAVVTDLDKEYQGKNYGEFKNDLANVVIRFLLPFQKEFKKLKKNPKGVREILKKGEKKARALAQKTMIEIKNKIGLDY